MSVAVKLDWNSLFWFYVKCDKWFVLYFFQVDSYILDESEEILEQPQFLVDSESEEGSQQLQTVDPETHARLEALLEAAGETWIQHVTKNVKRHFAYELSDWIVRSSFKVCREGNFLAFVGILRGGNLPVFAGIPAFWWSLRSFSRCV